MKNLYALGFALVLFSCGNAETESETTTDAPEVNQEEIIEMEEATNEVEEGLNDLEEDMDHLGSDIDSLLNGI